MARDATIPERPAPPKGRLSFPMMMLQMLGNPLASWGEDFYQEGVIVYRSLGLETAFVVDPALIQSVLLDDADSYSKQPLNDDVFGQAIGGGLLNAEGEDWRGNGGTRRRCSGRRRYWLTSPEKLREEGAGVTGERRIGRDDIGKLPLLDAVFQEACASIRRRR